MLTRTSYPHVEESWGYPLVSSPRVSGNSKSHAGTQICINYYCVCRFVSLFVRCNFERDANPKGPRHSTGRASVNCACGKYLSILIKFESLDTNLEMTGVKQGPCRRGL